MDQPVRTVMIAGGGNVGLRFALALSTGEGLDVAQLCSVKIIESSKRRAEVLAQQTPADVLVLLGDGTDEDLLTQEGVADVDLFVALTNDDENNIMSSLLAKRLGARRVIALINRKSYGDLMQGGQIDIAISPSYVTMSALLRFARRGDVVVAHTLRRAAAEALELIVHGDARSSRVVGKTIEQIEMPRGAIIGAIVRGHGDQAQVLMAHHDVAIQAEDHLIIFVENKRIIPRVEKIFTVGLGFF